MARTKVPVDVSAYDGVKFRIKSGSGTQNNVWFELLTTGDQPTEGGGTANTEEVDTYNAHGQMLNGIGTTWTDVFVPFGTLAPRWLPDGGSSACSSALCEAPARNPKTVLGLQFSVYDAFSTAAGYDLWVDDVKLYKGDSGFGTIDGASGSLKYPQNKEFSGCVKPSRADGRAVIALFNKWKTSFVDGTGSSRRVKSPDISSCNSAPCSVSEGIAYGMLIAAYMGDKKLFDDLWGYWKAHSPSGSTLMDWKIGAGGQPEGTGSASDADEDAAFALIVASKQWGDTYLTDTAGAKKMLADIWSKDISSNQVNGGSSYPSARNPSYLAPAYYRIFADYDTHDWNAVATTSYSMLKAISAKITGNLVPAWCTTGCADATKEGHPDGDQYQYDAHRMPWRIGVDACWNGNADAKAYVSTLVTFFANAAKTKGLGALADRYMTNGSPASDAAHNSMSLIGCAGVGAMAAGNQDFADRAYQFIVDASFTPKNIKEQNAATSYTYYNATVGLLTALTMTGNFYPPK